MSTAKKNRDKRLKKKSTEDANVRNRVKAGKLPRYHMKASKAVRWNGRTFIRRKIEVVV